MATGLVASDDMIVMCDEIIALVKRLLRSIEISPETLALDVIHQVGPGGYFLDHDHTVAHFRKEFALLKCMDRKNLASWENEGKISFMDKVRKQVEKILSEHTPEPLEEGLRKHIEEIVILSEKEG